MGMATLLAGIGSREDVAWRWTRRVSEWSLFSWQAVRTSVQSTTREAAQLARFSPALAFGSIGRWQSAAGNGSGRLHGVLPPTSTGCHRISLFAIS